MDAEVRVGEFPNAITTVDVVLLTVAGERLCVFLARRENDPHRGSLALPGGYIHVDRDRDAEDTARRVLATKVGLAPPYLEQLYTPSGLTRDPRGWSLSITYFALVSREQLAARDGVDAEIVPVDALPALPFDHAEIVATAVRRIRGKSTYSTLPLFLLPEEFTLSEAQEIYQLVLGQRLDGASFRRKVEEHGLISSVPGKRRTTAQGGRPSTVYRMSEPVLTEFDRMMGNAPDRRGRRER